jgi:hypothetical protein
METNISFLDADCILHALIRRWIWETRGADTNRPDQLTKALGALSIRDLRLNMHHFVDTSARANTNSQNKRPKQGMYFGAQSDAEVLKLVPHLTAPDFMVPTARSPKMSSIETPVHCMDSSHLSHDSSDLCNRSILERRDDHRDGDRNASRLRLTACAVTIASRPLRPRDPGAKTPLTI